MMHYDTLKNQRFLQVLFNFLNVFVYSANGFITYFLIIWTYFDTA